MSSHLRLARSTGPALEWALHYVDRGYAIIPIPSRSKNPGIKNWQSLRLTREQIESHFGSGPRNIGVLLGEPSGNLIDVDLDHALCVELAPQYLPTTDAIFGRRGKPRSHWIYRCVDVPATKKFRSRTSGMVVELRSTGQQTVFPPSIHVSGEAIEWEDDDAEPALVDAAVLLDAIKKLQAEVLSKLGERSAAQDGPTAQKSGRERIELCVRHMQRMGCLDGNDGSLRLFAAACRCVEHDLAPDEALQAIRLYEQIRPFPRSWSDDQIRRRLADAEKVAKRGLALRSPELDGDLLLKLGERDPVSGRIVLSPSKTLPTTVAFIDRFYLHEFRPTLVSYADQFMVWQGNRYVVVEEAGLRHQLQPWLHDALRYQMNKQTKVLELVDFESNPSTVEAALKSLHARTHLPASMTPPAWLDGRDKGPDPHDLLPFPSGTLNLSNNEVIAPTPALFNINALDFEYDANAAAPEEWLKFLEQLWGDDDESVQLLQEWMGYCLLADTRQQKMLLMVGPKRSGKGTIGRVLTRLVGAGNVVGPTTSGLAGAFGLQPLLGKSLAIVSDARFGGDGISAVVERLLTISGEDNVTVERKYLPSVTMKLSTRFVFLTNELPRLSDASGALAGRFLMLQLTNSFYGKEDTGLTQRLLSELPGILLWAIEGLRRLRERGHFVQPASVRELQKDMEDMTSPVSTFVRDCCILELGAKVSVQSLYDAWRHWCEQDGRTTPTTKTIFGRDLRAAFPQLRRHGNGVFGRSYGGIRLRFEGEFDD